MKQLGITAPNCSANNLFDRDLWRERQFDDEEILKFVQTNLPKLYPDQRLACDRNIHEITSLDGGLYFLNPLEGTGKTFLISLILSTIRSRNNIVLTIASFGIAATLLYGLRTAHSTLKLPFNIQIAEAPTSKIYRNFRLRKILISRKLIIWNKCNMTQKSNSSITSSA